jgi:hypothetical protein
MEIAILCLTVLAILLTLLNIYQFLAQRSALRIGEILYVMSRNVREKAAEVRREGKDVEIIEAHLFDLATSARTLLLALGRKPKTLGPDPVQPLTVSGQSMDKDSLVRMADNIFFSVTEEAPNATWDETVEMVMERFKKKAPNLDPEAARKVVTAVAQHFQRDQLKANISRQ